jgi:NADH-quinone oxidoreductase subunit K
MGDITLQHYLGVSAILFVIGLTGVILRRDLIVIYMSLELMLNAANLALVTFSRFSPALHGSVQLNGQVMVFFVITVAAAEVAVGLALIVALYRRRQTTKVDQLTSLKF